MGLFTSDNYQDLKGLFLNQLRDLYDAEHRIADVLPKMEAKAISTQLRDAFKKHLLETEEHIKRLDEVFVMLGVEAKREACEACKGLIREGQEMLDATGSHYVIDAGLILSAQRVEHYEIAGYGGARALALKLGLVDVAEILEDTLDEEKDADLTFTSIAEIEVNETAAKVVSNS